MIFYSLLVIQRGSGKVNECPLQTSIYKGISNFIIRRHWRINPWLSHYPIHIPFLPLENQIHYDLFSYYQRIEPEGSLMIPYYSYRSEICGWIYLNPFRSLIACWLRKEFSHHFPFVLRNFLPIVITIVGGWFPWHFHKVGPRLL